MFLYQVTSRVCCCHMYAGRIIKFANNAVLIDGFKCCGTKNMDAAC